MVRLVWVFVWFVLVLDLRAEEILDAECLECHEDEELVDDSGRSFYVDPEAIPNSVHDGYTCVECHTSIIELPHDEGGLPQVSCQICHEDSQEDYLKSAHGAAVERGDPDAPSCADCHSTHTIQASDDSESTVHPRNLTQTCAACHADPKVVQRHPFSVSAPVDAYKQGVHYRAMMERDISLAPSCTDCHGNHDLKASRDITSPIHWTHVPETCGKCHAGVLAVYQESVHGQAAGRGVRDAPVCTDCHGEHEIRGPEDPESTVYPAHVSKTTCVWCHESVRVVQKYGLPGGRLHTYQDSYHGLADRTGSTVVANCASCHGIHDIRPSDDPQSSIHLSNLPQTCGKCHPGAGENYALGAVHVNPGEENGGSAIVYYVRQFYILLILFTVGGMLVHNGLDFIQKFRSNRLPDGDDYLRFNVSERLQHATMALSFIVLAYSGFALKFPDAWWAAPFAWLSAGEESRRLVHRMAAVAMVAVCLYHLGYLTLSKTGRRELKAMLPRLKDVRDLKQMFACYLGLSNNHPAFDRFSYIEKVEYWALVWGSVIMTVTGFALWFENFSLGYIPKWGLDVATTIHYYEAWLAMLAILIWHFYWVIFNPKVYPMSLVWLTGKMSEEMMAEEHPLELTAVQKNRQE